MNYKDLTEEQVKELVGKRHRFTTEEMSIEDAINIFNPLKDGSIFKSYILLESIIPKEYLKEKAFFKGIIPKRYPITYGSVLAYADTSLKNDRELVEYCIEHHGSSSINALVSYIKPEDRQKLAEAKKDPNVYVEPEINIRGDVIGYKICSSLLKDKTFIESTLIKAEKGHDSSLASSLIRESSTCASDAKLVTKVIRIDAWSIYSADKELFKNEQFVISTIKTLVEQGAWSRFSEIAENYSANNKYVQKLIKTCNKLAELPDDAKIRKALYEKMANHYLSQIKVKETNAEKLTEV